MRLGIIAFSLLALACQSQTRPNDPPKPAPSSLLGLENIDKFNVPLGEFDSNQLKISWFRFAQIIGQTTENGRPVTRPIRYEPQWFAIYSHTWLRNKGPTMEEWFKEPKADPQDASKPLKELRVCYSDFGFPDVDVRRMVKYLIVSCHMREVPDIDPATLNIGWFEGMRRKPVTTDNWEKDVGLAKILVVESDKGRRVYLHLSNKNNSAVMAKSKVLHTEAARLMATFVPDAGGMRVDQDK